MKIKIFETHGVYTEDSDVYQVILDGYTDWDEITEDEYKNLQQYIREWNNKYRYSNNCNTLTLIRELDINTTKQKSIEYYKNKIQEQKEKEEKARLKQEERNKNKEKTELAKKKKQLEKLAKELQVEVIKK